ncbi:PREDICTED: dual specificity protein phosphatase 12-like isoform X1 [Polistes dominula]|uniref:protein-tyrosine-phosphatase n=1 Tax=Polistes dominula TaxID=743375 RepID=A0ABM1IG60_POLDO|nr:PREDICTED: dual specificity protein phosphatase 12-like isoform X1 [Polistes dominula]XP_015179198.1 PREDICTED: dual specificity protein phosphatase 12-like isoform X1 [Polistes dominula]XP_015179199.1 PREDICTED: dual specificity protein phosphatase 12-like isoform X1 [Polistes dominula]XP_015179200.1 PREDICTED: dual specificity protein phosphatase 12-like isoform X1 [Polistes dominula]
MATRMAQDEDNKLTREDFDAGPSSFDEVEPNLFLGNLTAATDVEWLKEINMTHILTVDSCPLPRKIQERLPNLIIKYIQITDMPSEDLLTHLEDSYEFINQALESKGRILVHCYFGVSRSVSVVIAYIMKKHRISFLDALKMVKEKRHFVRPNPGFKAQLKLYEEMDFGIDNTNIQFKMYRLQIAADKVRKVKILPQNCIDLIKPDPALTTVRPEPTVYRCKKCRRIVASASNILPHTTHQRPIWRHISSKRMPKQIKDGKEEAEHVNVKKENQMTELCTKIYFVEPLAWMPDIMHNVDGKLKCPKCNTKLGSFSWIAGSQCPCGSKIAPAFYLVPSKVDWSNAVQNVQVTV